MTDTAPVSEAQALGHRIRAARERAGLFQKDLAAATGVKHHHICRVERGHRQPSPVLVGKIAAACKVDVDQLLGSTS